MIKRPKVWPWLWSSKCLFLPRFWFNVHIGNIQELDFTILNGYFTLKVWEFHWGKRSFSLPSPSAIHPRLEADLSLTPAASSGNCSPRRLWTRTLTLSVEMSFRWRCFLWMLLFCPSPSAVAELGLHPRTVKDCWKEEALPPSPVVFLSLWLLRFLFSRPPAVLCRIQNDNSHYPHMLTACDMDR